MDDLFSYSIIIPHHNIPVLLKRCIHSIPCREDIQVIVIDDNSDEEYTYLLKEMEVQYPYVEFYYLHENGGGGRARNIGLNKAKGKYVLFADADDFFNYCIDGVLDDYKNESADIVFFASNSLDTYTYQNTHRNDLFTSIVCGFDGKNDFDLRYKYEVPWSRIINRHFLERNNILFQETIRHNDVGFSYLVGFYAKKIKVDQRAIYCVTTRSGSTSTNTSLNALKAGVFVYVGKYHFLISKGIKWNYPEYVSRALYYCRDNDVYFKTVLEYAVELGLTKTLILRNYYIYAFKVFIKSMKLKRIKK